MIYRFEKLITDMHEEGKLIFPGTLLARAAQRDHQKIAILCGQQSITFGELYARACALTHYLHSLGVQPGDRVALLFENACLYHAAYYGIWQTGAVIVPLNTFLTHKEIDHIIHDSQARIIITSTPWTEKLSKEEPLSAHYFDGQKIIEAAEALQAKPVNVPSIEQDALAALLYTSGTTGTPKGVMLSSRAIMTNIAQVISCADLINGNDRLYAILPLFHSFAQNTCVWSSIFVGVTTIIVPRIERKAILEGLEHKPTAMVGVPSLYGLFCLMKNAPIDSVRYFISGGDALPTKIKMAFELMYQRKLCNGYGLTEAAPFVAANLEDCQEGAESVGYLAPGIQARLMKEEGKVVPNDAIGILHIKGDNVMQGYYNAPEATAQMLHDGWLDTGDFATFDKKGRLYIVGRFKDLIINKGFNIYPPEIENVLMSHPAVTRAAVVGIPDESGGEVPVAFVTVRHEDPALVAELKQRCTKELAGYKIPKNYLILPELPLTSLAKVNKRELKKRYMAGEYEQRVK